MIITRYFDIRNNLVEYSEVNYEDYVEELDEYKNVNIIWIGFDKMIDK